MTWEKPLKMVPEVVQPEIEMALAQTKDSNDPLAPLATYEAASLEPTEILVPVETDDLVYSLRMGGHTSRQIAHHLSITQSQKWSVEDVDAALSRAGRAGISRTAAQLVFAAQLELDRIEAAIRAIWNQVQEGNLKAIDRFTKLSEAKRSMLGLDAPEIKLQLTLGQQDPVDYTVFTSEELETYLSLQRKAVSAAKSKVVPAVEGLARGPKPK